MYFVVYKLSEYHIERHKCLDSALSRVIDLASKGYPEVYIKRRSKLKLEDFEEL